jgi:hypothetical protein
MSWRFAFAFLRFSASVAGAMTSKKQTTKTAKNGGTATVERGNLAPFNAQTVQTAKRIASCVASKQRARWEGAGKPFPLATWDYAQTVTSAILESVASGEDSQGAIKAGCRAGNALLRKLSHADTMSPDSLSWIPQVSHREDDNDGAGLYALRVSLVTRAAVLRGRAWAVYDKARASKTRGNPRAALRADLRWIRRAYFYMRAQINGDGFSLRHAVGVSPAGKRGGKAKDERSAWKDLLRSHARTCARLGILPR